MTRFVTIAWPDSGKYSGKPVMLASDMEAWVAAGRPRLSGKQHAALCRTVAYNLGRDPEETVQLLSQSPASPSGRTAGIPPKAKMATAAKSIKKARRKARRQMKLIRRHLLDRGVPKDEIRIMCRPGVDPELVSMWVRQMSPASSTAMTLDADNRDRAMLMAQPGVDPALRAMFLDQQAPAAPEPARGPLGMDQDRYELHQEAKQLAADKMRADPRLSAADAYTDSVIMLAERENESLI